MPQALIGLLLALVLPLPVLAQARDGLECRGLRERRDAIAYGAMQEEIALLHAVRLRLCPQQETLADQAHAKERAPQDAQAASAAQAAAERLPVQDQVDYGAYIQCRRDAERQLQRSRVILYRNLQGFTFYTARGARLAREADALQRQFTSVCEPPPSATTPLPAPARSVTPSPSSTPAQVSSPAAPSSGSAP